MRRLASLSLSNQQIGSIEFLNYIQCQIVTSNHIVSSSRRIENVNTDEDADKIVYVLKSKISPSFSV